MDYYLEGYTDQLSYRPGEEIGLHVSTNAPTFTLHIRRVGAQVEGPVYTATFPGREHPTPENASSEGCRWPVTLPRIPITEAWRSGLYGVATLLPDGSRGGTLYFVVRSARPGRDANILLQLTTNTHNAYNNWGGCCFYPPPTSDRQVPRLSFDRPGVWGHLADWERPFIQWAEQAGFALDYAVNTDLEIHPEMLQGYRLVLSVGHDEYWSAPMRDSLEGFIAAGGNAAFFSGNSVCWQVRTEEQGRALVCWKERFQEDPCYHPDDPGHPDHRFLTAFWSHPWIKRPENSLTGVGTRSGGYSVPGQRRYTVCRPEHWVFAGTGLTAGSTFGRRGDEKWHSIVGYECDGCEWTEVEGLPIPTHRDGTPEGFTILAHAPAAWGDDWLVYPGPDKPRATGAAVMGIYTRGGTVFTAGSIGWANGLRDRDPVVERITRNVLERLGRPAA